jgi:hypothetical protein
MMNVLVHFYFMIQITLHFSLNTFAPITLFSGTLHLLVICIEVSLNVKKTSEKIFFNILKKINEKCQANVVELNMPVL